MIRATTDPLVLSARVRSEVQAVDKGEPVYHIRTMDEILSGSMSQRRFQLILICGFASLALILAAVGIYGVMAYSVNQRTHEIGIRMALGASPGDILRLLIRQAILLIVLGISAGLVLASALTRVLATLLFGVRATDATVFTGCSLVLSLTALAACCLPTLRAIELPPVVALRNG